MRMKQYDLYPFEYTILDSDKTPIDLTNATSVTMTLLNDSTGLKVVDARPCIVINPTAGIIRYDWLAGETDASAMYKMEFRIIFWDETMVTVPTNDIIWLFIMPAVHAKVVP